MLTLHHLRIGRSIFTVWLAEELELDYQIQEYLRNPETMRAPATLKNVNPLGRSPAIEDDGMVLCESGAITCYLLEKYDPDHKFSPRRTDLQAWAEYMQWLVYPEASVFAPLFMRMLAMRSAEAKPFLESYSAPEIALHFGHMANKLAGNEFILGDNISGADFGISYVIGLGERLGAIADYPTLTAYLARNRARPAFVRALARAVE